MRNIIWVASFPKSGNTWMRALLANYILKREDPFPINDLGSFSLSDIRPRFFHEASGKPVEQLSQNHTLELRLKSQQLISESKPHDHFVKTHSRFGSFKDHPLINSTVSKGAIYLVRNPLDIVISFASHLGTSIDEAIDLMDDPLYSTKSNDSNVLTILGGWSGHVDSWLTNKSIPRILVRYEDLEANPNKEFSKILNTLGINIDQTLLKKSVEFSSFSELSEQESKSGFRERPPHAEQFFRKGTSGQWNLILEDRQIRKIVNSHGLVMKRLGYNVAV